MIVKSFFFLVFHFSCLLSLTIKVMFLRFIYEFFVVGKGIAW